MVSWKLSLLVLVAVVFVLAIQTDATRNGRRRAGHGRGVGRRRGGNRGVSTTEDNNGENQSTDTDQDAGSTVTNTRRRGGRRGGGRGGRRRGNRGRPGGRRPGGRGRGGRRRGGRRPNVADTLRLFRDYSLSNGNFAVRLYGEMVKTNDNFVISPLSIHSALSMLLLGAGGTTKRELIRGLHVRSPVHPAFRLYNQSLDHGAGENTTLALANALYTKRGFSPKNRFINKMRMFYEASLSEFDESDPEGVINDWVADKTNDKIPDFLSDGEVTDDMVMMLINAVYFKGLWRDAFDADDTSLETFTDLNSQTHDVYMVKRDGYYNMYHSSVLGAQALKIPYKGDRYSFNIILPDENNDLATVESRLTHEVLNETLRMLSGYRGTKAMLEMPKFSMDTEESMADLLRSIGISNVFEDNANFRRMTSSRNVKVNKVKHRCIIEVDEQGTEAAASTGISVVLTSMSLPFRVNRPFIFVLRDDHHSIVLFMGRYVNPQGDNLD